MSVSTETRYRLIRITAASLALKISVNGQVKFMKENGFDVTMVSSPGPEVNEVIAKEGCPHIAINISRKISPLTDIKTIYSLYKTFRKLKPDIIHSNNLKANLLGMIAGWLAGVPVRVQTMAGLVSPNVSGIKGWLIRNAEIISFHFATNVWPNSHSSLKYMLDTRMVSARKVKVIGGGSTNGIDINKYNLGSLDATKLEQIKATIDHKEGDRVLLFAGRMVKDKGIEELVKVFQQLKERYKGLKLVILGPEEAELDPLSADIKSAIENDPAIIHISWTEEVQYYMALAELFVFPSHREGFPNVLMQAGAMQCLVVCSIIIGNTDIVEDKISGLMHAVKDESALKDCLVFALDNKAAMKKMSDELYRKITTGYDKMTLYNQYKQAYIQLIEKSGNNK